MFLVTGNRVSKPFFASFIPEIRAALRIRVIDLNTAEALTGAIAANRAGLSLVRRADDRSAFRIPQCLPATPRRTYNWRFEGSRNEPLQKRKIVESGGLLIKE